jgi:hypothetical protein
MTRMLPSLDLELNYPVLLPFLPTCVLPLPIGTVRPGSETPGITLQPPSGGDLSQQGKLRYAKERWESRTLQAERRCGQVLLS